MLYKFVGISLVYTNVVRKYGESSNLTGDSITIMVCWNVQGACHNPNDIIAYLWGQWGEVKIVLWPSASLM